MHQNTQRLNVKFTQNAQKTFRNMLLKRLLRLFMCFAKTSRTGQKPLAIMRRIKM